MEQKVDYIVFFDGECNFCCSWINTIIKNDPKGRFKFSQNQSDFSRKFFLNMSGAIDIDGFSSIVLYSDGKFLIKSTAVLEIARNLKFPFPLVYFFKIVPVFISDYVYGVFSKNRYKWFGKKQNCMVPDEGIRSRFLN